MRSAICALLMVCLATGVTGADPVEKWRMAQQGGDPDYDRVFHVLVAPFTDVNGDGRVDAGEGLNVIALTGSTFVNRFTKFRILDAATGADLRSLPNPTIAASGPASGTVPVIADLEGDGRPEIIYASRDDTFPNIVAVSFDGSWKWTSPRVQFYDLQHRSICVFDLEGDGRAEVLASNSILEADGTRRVTLPIEPCVESWPIDVNLDGIAEIFCGGTVVDLAGNVVIPNPLGAGFRGVPVELDGDPRPEILLYGGAHRYAIDDDGTEIWRAAPGGRDASECQLMPVADFDGDGSSDIAIGLADSLGAGVSARGALDVELWHADSLEQCTESGSLAQVDGRLMLLNQDWDRFRLIDVSDGSVAFTIPQITGTAWEAPPFVDLDADGHGDIVLKSTTDATMGLRVFSDPTWCGARAIWNQSCYVPEWIGDDLRPGSARTPILNWAATGFRKQAEECPCFAPIDVTIELQRSCVDGETCARAISTGPGPHSLEWTFPDGTVSTDEAPCFAVPASGSVSVRSIDSAGCRGETTIPVEPPIVREVSILTTSGCSDEPRCVEASFVGGVGPFVMSWTLPDGSLTSDERPCFSAASDGTVAVTVTDTADGCIRSQALDVDPVNDAVPAELSGGAEPLFVTRRAGSIHFAWEPTSGADVALLMGELATWYSHEPVYCGPGTATTQTWPAEGDVYYLVAELSCSRAVGMLGSASTGAPRPAPVAACP